MGHEMPARQSLTHQMHLSQFIHVQIHNGLNAASFGRKTPITVLRLFMLPLYV